MTEPAATPPPLALHEALLILIRLEKALPYLDELYRCLSHDEVERAGRFAFEKDFQQFVLSRGVLRRTLGHYFDREAQDIKFDYSPYGKPSLNVSAGETPICFNLSHSYLLALIGLTNAAPVGVDVERARPEIITDDLIRAVLSPRERVQFTALPAHHRAEAFFELWTLKEAVLKAIGSGHTLPMTELDLGLTQEGPKEARRISTKPGEDWSAITFWPQPDYAASAVAKGHEMTFRFLEWDRQYL